MFNTTIFSLGQVCNEFGDVLQTLIRQILVFLLGTSSAQAATPNFPDQLCKALDFTNFPNNLLQLIPSF